MRLIVACLSSALASASVTQADFLYMQHLAKMNKSIKSVEEFQMRLALFSEIDAIINEHNNSNEHSYTLGHNLFSDLTPEERKMYIGQMMNNPPPIISDQNHPVFTADTEQNLPDSVEWKSSSCMAPI